MKLKTLPISQMKMMEPSTILSTRQIIIVSNTPQSKIKIGTAQRAYKGVLSLPEHPARWHPHFTSLLVPVTKTYLTSITAIQTRYSSS